MLEKENLRRFLSGFIEKENWRRRTAQKRRIGWHLIPPVSAPGRRASTHSEQWMIRRAQRIHHTSAIRAVHE